MRLAVVKRNILRTLKGPGSLEESSVAQEMICPVERVLHPQPICIPDQLDRVTGTPTTSTLAAEMGALTSVETVHDATIAYHFNNATIVDGSIYSENFRYFISDEQSHTLHRDLKCASLVSSMVSQTYFGHWLADGCVQYLLPAQQRINVGSIKYPDAAAYAEIFGQDWSSIVVDDATVSELIITADYAQNSSKRKRYEILHSKIVETFGKKEKTSLVYLRRGSAGTARLIENEDDLIEALVRRGFEILEVDAGVERISASLLSAKLLVSIEGSHCAHAAISMQPGSGIVVLEPPERFTICHKGWADCRSIRFGFVVGFARSAGSFFPIADVLRTIDLMLDAV
jgi:hypothetical protein